jgi:hypothetical protein
MPHVIVRLEDQEFSRLAAMAARQTREVDQQATYLVRRAIVRAVAHPTERNKETPAGANG